MNKKLLDSLSVATQPTNGDQWYFYVIIIALLVAFFIYLKFGNKQTTGGQNAKCNNEQCDIKFKEITESYNSIRILVERDSERIRSIKEDCDDLRKEISSIRNLHAGTNAIIMEKLGEIQGEIKKL